MRAKEAAKMLGGSVVIYVVMAACSAGNATTWATSSDDGGTDDSGSGEASASGGGSNDGSGSRHDGPSILDALTDPVAEAKADPNQSGTRLKVNYYAGTDGSKQVTAGTMHDSMLNVDCNFTTMSDGTTRCAPIGGGTASMGSFYSDSGCSQALAVTSTCTGGSTPHYAAQTSLSCGTFTYHLFQVSGAFTGTVYSGTSSNCTANSAAASSYTFFSVGAELPPSTFVQATVQTEP